MENIVSTNGTGMPDSAGLLSGLLIGGLVGFGAMLLLAPQSGQSTRAQIKQKSAELQDRATNTFDDLMALSHYDKRIILAGGREKTKVR